PCAAGICLPQTSQWGTHKTPLGDHGPDRAKPRTTSPLRMSFDPMPMRLNYAWPKFAEFRVCEDFVHVNPSRVQLNMDHVHVNLPHVQVSTVHVQVNTRHVHVNMARVQVNMPHMHVNMVHVHVNTSDRQVNPQ